jgi:hypothetical protein
MSIPLFLFFPRFDFRFFPRGEPPPSNRRDLFSFVPTFSRELRLLLLPPRALTF